MLLNYLRKFIYTTNSLKKQNYRVGSDIEKTQHLSYSVTILTFYYLFKYLFMRNKMTYDIWIPKH